MNAAPTISIVSLFLNADIVVKGVLLLLLAASVWSWAVIIDKLWRLGAISRPRASTRHGPPRPRTAEELWAGPRTAQDPAAQVIAAGLRKAPPRRRPMAKRRPSGASGSSARCGWHSIARCVGSKRGCRSSRHWARRRRLSVCSAPSGGSCAALPGSPPPTTPASPLWRRASPRRCSRPRWGSPRRSPPSSPTTKSPSSSGRFAGRMQGLIGRSGGLLARAAGV